MTPLDLAHAIVQHDGPRIRALIAEGVDPNSPNEAGWRPLHLAIGQLGVGGLLEIVELLIRHGADVNAWDGNRNETPIFGALDPPELAAARMLLEAGADPNVRRSTHETPLQLAVEQGSLEMAAILLSHGAERTLDEWGGLRGLTPLGMAARNLDVPLVELLLSHGASPGALDEYDEAAHQKMPARPAHDAERWDRVLSLLRGGVSLPAR